MAEVGTGIPLTSRRAECPMPLPVTDRRVTITPDPSLLAAGADVAEADPTDGVASNPSVIDAERDPLYGDGVKHSDRAAPMTPADHRTRRSSLSTDEHIRQSRLSRWQEQR